MKYQEYSKHYQVSNNTKEEGYIHTDALLYALELTGVILFVLTFYILSIAVISV